MKAATAPAICWGEAWRARPSCEGCSSLLEAKPVCVHLQSLLIPGKVAAQVQGRGVLPGPFLFTETQLRCYVSVMASWAANWGRWSPICAEAQEGTCMSDLVLAVVPRTQDFTGEHRPHGSWLPGRKWIELKPCVLPAPGMFSRKPCSLQKGLQVQFPVTATLRPLRGSDSRWEWNKAFPLYFSVDITLKSEKLYQKTDWKMYIPLESGPLFFSSMIVIFLQLMMSVQ